MVISQVSGLVPPSRHIEESSANSGACRWISSTVSSQESAASPPLCTRTNAGSAMAGSFSAVRAGQHRRARDATARQDSPVKLASAPTSLPSRRQAPRRRRDERLLPSRTSYPKYRSTSINTCPHWDSNPDCADFKSAGLRFWGCDDVSSRPLTSANVPTMSQRNPGRLPEL